ncbi:XRE family transcriptional regulator [Leptolyngbya boryana NIES-2135]|jgi:excinuclease UvrABC nuclease subunit|uniref:XRE family transcriptional regulator n=1 Tax=Leptolyngbya boryana NIES-2135 TaxID=1973484 RepID=A0A1Z4JP73_LEPBY|nr:MULTISPECIES: helix-turn-helix domain-containing protein [Leptolyngbya]BAY58532.1 XRE family transcriptional regulator [Leptolyngbya boryana NIES-2135]MBD2370787.1 helix-turn-helix domain-containing protein [Leptolyngbya sp. FACHB-161]MBD2377060.1 helix-turn-helix domain-containing protein [Leptolyngbya sp. FACHB-238]MBD2401503.1 helix-turn-helix domain-containing protein [Leptolyngbya sp. FACHB-239]MBD2408055.1 helix-turn-helix domain-containing protein [Leptolyngbya sp. FACHB-402]
MNPTEINPLDLPFVPLEQRSQLPETPCIYFAIDGEDAVQYIGRASNLRHRWQQHHRFDQLNQSSGSRIAYLSVSDSSLLPEVEKALIGHFSPPLNGASIESKGFTTVYKTVEIEVPELGKRIRAARKADGRAVTQIAAAAGMSVQNWYRIEDERQSLSVETLRLIEKVLNTDFGVEFSAN